MTLIDKEAKITLRDIVRLYWLAIRAGVLSALKKYVGRQEAGDAAPK